MWSIWLYFHLQSVVALHQGVPGQMLCRNTSALAAALAVKICNNTIIYQDISTALAIVTNDLSMPCHEQRTGAATVCSRLTVLRRYFNPEYIQPTLGIENSDTSIVPIRTAQGGFV